MASGNIKGITIEFKGDTTQLGKALSQVNKEIKQTDSALRDIDKALKLDPGNVDLLAQKEALLAKQIEQTKTKLDLQKQAATEAAKALENGTISQEEYAKLSAELATTASKLDKLEGEAKETSEALNGAGKEAQTTGKETEDAGNKAEKSGEKWQKFGEAAKAACAVAAAGVAAVTAAVGASMKALADFSTAGAHYADEVLSMSAVTGVSTERLQELQYAAELVDVPVETLTGAMTKAEKSIASAASGTGATADAFKQLGVAVTDANGNLRSGEDVLFESLEALGKIENETERDTVAMSLFGKSAKDLNPLIKAGAGALEEYAQQAHDVGYVLSDDTLDAFGEFDDTLVKLNNGTTAAKNALGTVLLPILTKVGGEGVDLLGDFSKAVLNTNGDLGKVGQVVNEFVPKVVSLVQTYVPQFLQIAQTILGAIVTAITSNLQPILECGLYLIQALVSGISEQGPPLIQAATDAVLLIAQTLLSEDNLVNIINAAVTLVTSLVSGLTKTLPKLVPVAVNAILTIAKTILDPTNLKTIITAAAEIVISVTQGILQTLPEIIPVIVELFVTVVNAILDPSNLNTVITAAVQIITAVCSGISSALPQLIPAIVSAITTITTELTKAENLELIIKAAVQIIGAVVKGLVQALPDLAAGLLQVTGAIVDSLANLAKDAVTWGADLIASFVRGIKDNIPSLGEAASGAAKKVKDFLGFSEPKDGPLSNFHTFAPDMMDLFAEGIDENVNVVQKSVEEVAGVVAGGMTQAPDYTGQFNGLQNTLGQIAANGGGQIVIPVYLGNERIDTLVVNAVNRQNYRSGGR